MREELVVFETRLSCQRLQLSDYVQILFRSAYYAPTFMYLIAIGWIYVVLLMSVAEATSTTGSVLGALITFVLYGALPLSLVLYIMRTPARKRTIKAREKAEDSQRTAASENKNDVSSDSVEPNASGHAASAASADSIPAVRKEL
jgi:amino acid permease